MWYWHKDKTMKQNRELWTRKTKVAMHRSEDKSLFQYTVLSQFDGLMKKINLDSYFHTMCTKINTNCTADLNMEGKTIGL